jgi:hypothetical protein
MVVITIIAAAAAAAAAATQTTCTSHPSALPDGVACCCGCAPTIRGKKRLGAPLRVQFN